MKNTMLTWALVQILNLNESNKYLLLFFFKMSDLENYVTENVKHAPTGFGFARMVIAKLGMCKEGKTYTPGE